MNTYQVLFFGMHQSLFMKTYKTRYDSHVNITSVYVVSGDIYAAIAEISNFCFFLSTNIRPLLITDEDYVEELLYSDWVSA